MEKHIHIGVGVTSILFVSAILARLHRESHRVAVIVADDQESESPFKSLCSDRLPVEVEIHARPIQLPEVKYHKYSEPDPHPHIPKHVKYGYRQKQRHRK